MTTKPSLLPVFLKLEGRSCLVVGAGKIALAKIESLLGAGAKVRVVAPQASAEVRALAGSGRIVWSQRPFVESDLEGAFLLIAATDRPEVNHHAYEAATARGILANAVDDPPFCDFYFSSVVQRQSLQIAISTAGESPALAQRLRREIDAMLPEELGPWLEQLGALRREVLARQAAGAARTELLHTLAQRELCASESCPTRALAHNGAAPRARGREETWWIS